MMGRPYHLRPYEPPVTRPETDDERDERLMELERREASRYGRKSNLRNNVEVLVAILREKGIVTDEHNYLFEKD